MDKILFENPPVLAGTPEIKLNQMYHYLFQISNQLNEALMSVSIEQMEPETRAAIQKAAGANEAAEADYTKLKSLIIKNAEIVRAEMTEIRTYLDSHYEAISEQFGTFQQDIHREIVETAQGTVDSYQIDERISDLQAETADFINSINAYIYSGILDTSTGEVGIAIGYNVTNPNGSLNQQNKMATFTADALKFYLNDPDNPVAYFSNNVFHIEAGEVTNSMRMGSYIWKVMNSTGAMGLMKA